MTTIREMCDTYNVTPRTLRFYEQRGLLSPIRHGTRREFTEACKKRVELILRLKGFGFSLDDVEAVMNVNIGGTIKGEHSREFVRQTALRTLSGLQDHIDKIQESYNDLRDALDPAQGMKAFELEGA